MPLLKSKEQRPAMINKRKVWVALRAILLLGLFGAFGFFMFTLKVLNEVPLERLEKVASSLDGARGQNEIYLSDPSVIESGSLVRRSDLALYGLFAAEQVQLEELLEQEKKSELGVDEDLELPRFFRNDCPTIYCYQRRIPFEQIPSPFWKGLIGIEDARFLDHPGIDVRSIARALITDIIEMRFVQGGSTVTQQLVKNLFLSNEKTIVRKLKEVIVALYVEAKYPKENILEAYFNEFEWGALQGIKIKGLYAASLFYFGKRPWEVTPYEASILIGLLKGPYYYRPLSHLDRLKNRTAIVTSKLVELGLYTAEELAPWSDEQWFKFQERLLEGEKERPYFSAWWLSRTHSHDAISPFEKLVLHRQVYKVLKTFDDKEADLAAKIVIGAGLGNYDPANTFNYYSKFERDQEVAIAQERHQVGSTLKPIVYGIYLAQGSKISDEVETGPLTLKLKSGPWSPRESHDNIPARMSIENALRDSLNRPVIRLAQQYGFDVIQAELLKYFPQLQVPLAEYPAQLLGALESTPRDLFHSFQEFTRRACAGPEAPERDILLDVLSDPEQTTVRRRVSKRMGAMRFFGKTGTSNNGQDNWFVGFDGAKLAVIWVGNEGRRGESDLLLYGSSTAFEIYQGWLEYRGRRLNELQCGIEARIESGTL